VADYRSSLPPIYDFKLDPIGDLVWHREARKVAGLNPLKLTAPSVPSPDDVLTVALSICDKFKQLVENNALSHLLYGEKNRPKHESAAQRLFYGIADSYCEANNLDISPELNSGRGEIDFKLSNGYQQRVVIEIKLTTNRSLLHGYDVQLVEYEKAEKTKKSIFLVLDVAGGSRNQFAEVKKKVEKAEIDNVPHPYIVFVDARPKASASVYRPPM
jgi:hypothetical protein